MDWQIERENLEVFTRARHPNIVQALFFYQWRGQINFVFPFIDGTLENLLSGQWTGPDKDYLETRDPPYHWLWTQMIGIAEGLSTIHNPQNISLRRNEKRTVGFHFDLRPANILITMKGELKISDFGLSLIRRLAPDSQSYGGFRGGDPRYQAPEVSPTASEDVSESVRNRYDVWSYACIVLEVLIYLSGKNGVELLKRFHKAMDAEPPGCAFFGNKKLKICVDEALRDFDGDTLSEMEMSQPTWAHDTAELLRQMFAFKPSQRPSSRMVADALRSHQDKHMDMPIDELEMELRKHSELLYPEERYTEICRHTAHGDMSYIQM